MMPDQPPPPYGPPYGAPVSPFRQGFYPTPPPATDSKAVLSLVLGIFSIFGCGLFLAVPAIVLGVVARRDAERTGGPGTGTGLATAGIVTGAIGAVLTLVWVGIAALALIAGAATSEATPVAPSPSVAPSSTAAPAEGDPASEGTAAAPAASAEIVSTTIDVVALVPSPTRLREQLKEELRAAQARGETLLVQTSAAWAPVCSEIDVSLGDKRMEAALAKVRLVRVDVDGFESDLKTMRMYEGSVPWFYLLDAKTARPLDAIGADEWDDNVPENMAPVLGAFVKGKYGTRRHGSPLGGTSL
jgi:hypothetical protein